MSATRDSASSETDAVDPDVDVHVPRQRQEASTHRGVVPVIALGGMLGASARHSLELLWPTLPEAFPWATFAANVSGCLLIGVLMVHVVEAGAAHPLVRPFLGVGLLGGYTTFSTYAVQGDGLLTSHHPGRALAYLIGTLAAAMVSVALGVFTARAGLRLRPWFAHRRGGSR
jgi:CrcB protein